MRDDIRRRSIAGANRIRASFKRRETVRRPSDKSAKTTAVPEATTEIYPISEATASSEYPIGSFLVDSGCPRHICIHRDAFESLVPHNLDITLANGTVVHATHSGTITLRSRINNITRHIVLHDALFVPDIKLNLFSIPALRGQNFSVVFTDNVVNVNDGNTVMIRGFPWKEGIFLLNVQLLLYNSDCPTADFLGHHSYTAARVKPQHSNYVDLSGRPATVVTMSDSLISHCMVCNVRKNNAVWNSRFKNCSPKCLNDALNLYKIAAGKQISYCNSCCTNANKIIESPTPPRWSKAT